MGSGALGSILCLSQPALWVRGCAEVLRLNHLKNKGFGGVSSSVVSLDVSAVMVVVGKVVHVLHRDPAPHTDHKCFNLTLIVPASDAEVTILSPVLSPGVCRNLERKVQTNLLLMTQISI